MTGFRSACGTVFVSLCIVWHSNVVFGQLLASESFDYPLGSISGRNGGSGFSGAWSSSGTSSVTAPGLNFPTGIVGVGNALTWSNGSASRAFTTQLVAGTTCYMSCLCYAGASPPTTILMQFTTSDINVHVAVVRTSTQYLISTASGGTTSSVAPRTNVTDQLVFRLAPGAGNQWVATLFVNPTSNTPTAAATLGLSHANTFLGIRCSSGTNSGVSMDELRVGRRIEDVVPFNCNGNGVPDAQEPVGPLSGWGLQFAGTNGVVTAELPPVFEGDKAFTVEYWMYYQAQPTRAWVMDIGDRATNQACRWLVNTTGMTEFGFWGTTTQNQFNISAQFDRWSHIATVYDNTSHTLFTTLDGYLASTAPVGSPPNLRTGAGQLRIAQPVSGESSFRGLMMEYRLWDVARTPYQIRGTMRRSLTGSESGLQVYYKFDGSGSTEKNRGAAGLASSATLSGAVSRIFIKRDCNANNIPDECEADADGDGAIDACDLCPGTPAGAFVDAQGCPLTTVPGDFDSDGDVDLQDFVTFQKCFNGPNRPPAQPACGAPDFDDDADVDLGDFVTFQGCFNGPNRPPTCQ